MQWYATHLGFPHAGDAPLSREVWQAYERTPVSHYLQPFTKAPVNFSAFFAMTPEQRSEMRRSLAAIPPSARMEPQPDKPNYEATQTPLPYLLMALPDAAGGSWPLVDRVLWLRIVCSVLIVLLIANSSFLLASELDLKEPFATAAVFCVFTSQMVLAVIGHISNDGFAIPALTYMVWALVRAARLGGVKPWLVAGLITAAALLCKAYVLFVTPVAALALGWSLLARRTSLQAAAVFAIPVAVLAGPWYARNLMLYHNLTGTLETTSGLSLASLRNGALRLPWRESIPYMAHTSLWTGNNSFTTFSMITLNVLLALLALGGCLFAIRLRREIADCALAAAIVLFSGGLGFIAVAFYISSRGGAIAPMPWYAQVLVPLVMLAVLSGYSRFRKLGRWGAAVTVLGWAYLIISTYYVKLAPLYGGFSGRSTLGAVWQWYLSDAARRNEILTHTCMAPAPVLWTLIAIASISTLATASGLLWRLICQTEPAINPS